jgi:DNA topoisomerase I
MNLRPKYITIRGKGDILKELRDAARQSHEVLLATDPDREGEAISWHLAHALNMDPEAPCRVSFNEITKTAVKSAIDSKAAINIARVDAQQARRILDRLVGYQLSPLLWRKVKKGLSAGRVQSVAVRLICDREDEIDNFVSEEYWSLHGHFSHLEPEYALKAQLARIPGVRRSESRSADEAHVLLKKSEPRHIRFQK